MCYNLLQKARKTARRQDEQDSEGYVKSNLQYIRLLMCSSGLETKSRAKKARASTTSMSTSEILGRVFRTSPPRAKNFPIQKSVQQRRQVEYSLYHLQLANLLQALPSDCFKLLDGTVQTHIMVLAMSVATKARLVKLHALVTPLTQMQMNNTLWRQRSARTTQAGNETHQQ